MIKAIFAIDSKGGFGLAGRLPWPKNKDDMDNFRKYTHNTNIVMGRNTYNTLPTLPYRNPVVVTSRRIDKVDCLFSKRWLEQLEELHNVINEGTKDYIIIGGSQLLTKETLSKCDEIRLTVFKGEFEADVTIPEELITWLDMNSEYLRTTILETDELTIFNYRKGNDECTTETV